MQERLIKCASPVAISPLELAAKIVARGGLVTVDELVVDCGIKERRQLERRFLQEVGIGPKLLLRVGILRFQQVFRAVERDTSSGRLSQRSVVTGDQS